MKKLIYLALAILPFGAISQNQDSLAQAIIEQGLNLLVIEPGEDPNGAQGRPCGTFVVHVSACGYVYQVICGGEVKWQSQVFYDPNCSYFTSPRFILPKLCLTIPTPENPLTDYVSFDMSILLDEESLTEEEYRELLAKYNNFYFELEEDLLLDNDGYYTLLKAGNYTINQGEMAMKFYFTTY